MMDILTDKSQRRYFVCMMVILFLASAFAVAIWAGSGQRIKGTVLNHDKRVVSSLIGQGVDEAVIAKAFAEKEITQEGTELLERIGIHEGTEIVFMPDVFTIQRETGLQLAGLFLLLWTGLLLLAVSFFSARKQVYERAIRLVEQFMEGDFREHLPRMDEGGLYRLLGKLTGLRMHCLPEMRRQ